MQWFPFWVRFSSDGTKQIYLPWTLLVAIEKFKSLVCLFYRSEPVLVLISDRLFGKWVKYNTFPVQSGWLKLFPFFSITLCRLLNDSVINWIHSSNIARKIMPVADKYACFRQNSCGRYCFPLLLSYHGGFSINWSGFFLCRCQTTLLLLFSIKIQLGISRTTFLLLAVSRSLHHHTEILQNFHWFACSGRGEFSLSQSLALLWKVVEKSAPNYVFVRIWESSGIYGKN